MSSEAVQSWARQVQNLAQEKLCGSAPAQASNVTRFTDCVALLRPFDISEMPQYAWAIVAAVLGGLVFLKAFGGENDKPVRYMVPSPKTPEKVEILQKPSIRVSLLSMREMLPYEAWLYTANEGETKHEATTRR